MPAFEVTPARREPVGWHWLLAGPVAVKSRTLADEMHDATLRHIPSPPTRARRAPAECDLFEVEKVTGIRRTDRFEHLAAHHHARSGDPITRMRFCADGRRDEVAFQESRCDA